jgi:hypothetical protein
MRALCIALVLVGCSEKKPAPKAEPTEQRGPPDYDPTQYKKFSCVDLIPESFRADYKPDKPESDRFGNCDLRSEIEADDAKCYVNVVCMKELSAANAEELFRKNALSQNPVKIEGVGTAAFMDATKKPKSLYFMVIDEKLDCSILGILPPGTDVKALASGTLDALAKRL